MRVRRDSVSTLAKNMSSGHPTSDTSRGNALHLGTIFDGNRVLALPPQGRSTHLYVCGGSGVGKSKLLEYLLRQDIKAWRERCVNRICRIVPRPGIFRRHERA
jgi:DNA helicase HerA-like ATPase